MPARIDVRSTISEAMRSRMGGFDPFDPQEKGYWFRKTRTLTLGSLYETVIFASSGKFRCFEVSVCSSMFPVWSGGLGERIMEHGTGLANLRLDSTMIPMEEIPYNHDGTEGGVTEAVSRILRDLEKHAIPFFERRATKVEKYPLLELGFTWLGDHRAEIDEKLIRPLETGTLSQGEPYRVTASKIVDILWDDLLHIAHDLGMDKEGRRAVLRLAWDLIGYDVFIRGNIKVLKK